MEMRTLRFPELEHLAGLSIARVVGKLILPGEVDAYTCGPPPMVDALLPVLQRLGVALDRTYVDKFTQASATAPNHVH